VLLASLAIRYTCDAFEPAADYLGRNLPAGVKGATINAVGSSLPELLTSFVLVFEFADRDGFAAAVATCAGSAVFNVIVIPALCVLAVVYIGVKQPDGSRTRQSHMTLDRWFLVRNGMFFLLGEIVLIMVMGQGPLTWMAGASLMMVYLVYLGSLWGITREYAPAESEDRGSEPTVQASARSSRWLALIYFDFNEVLFSGRAYTTRSAWIVLSLCVVVLGIACHFLGDAVIMIADGIGVAPYFTALVIAAVATSIPDAILSVKDSLKGCSDDAIANAVGSNTFDIGIGIGFPLLAYTLIHGPISVSTTGNEHEIRVLLIVLLAVTVFSMALLVGGRRVGRKRALSMLAVYAAFTVWVIGAAFDWWTTA
jgi:cation:H+ antiporter